MAKPKVLLFFEYGTLNGGEISMLTMLEELGQTEFEFAAAAPASGMLTKQMERYGFQILPLMLKDTKGQKRPVEQINSHLLELATQVSPDLIHSNSLSMGRMVGRIAMQVPMPCTSHIRDIIKLNKTAVSDLNQNSGLIAVSNATKEFHIEQGISPAKLKVIYNGVNTDIFSPKKPTGILKQQLRLSDNAVLLANIGQICLRKGQTLLAHAAVSLADEFPEAKYLFIGQRHSQKQESIAYENSIKLIFRQAGIESRLFFLGFREDIPDILNEIDLLVHTAHQEPLGRVLIEAASCAQAIVATNVGGTAEILTDQVSAILIQPDNIEALKDAIRWLLTDSDLRICLGQQARTAVIENFPIQNAAAQIGKFWNSFI